MDYITLPNGRQAISFVPEDSKDLGIVHISTIKRLAALLPSVPFHDIRAQLLEQIRCSPNLPTTIELCNEFTAFHETINLINSYDPDASQKAQTIIQKKEERVFEPSLNGDMANQFH